MSLFLDIVVGSAVVMLAVSAFLFLILVMRNPFVPAWVHGESAAQAIPLLMTTCSVSGLAFAAHVYNQAGLAVMPSLLAALGVAILATIAFCWITGFRMRLKRAADGFSPFAPLDRTPHVPGQGAGAA